jgi:hypothetical protein
LTGLVLPGLAWSCLVLPGLAWSCLVLPGLAWSCLVLPGLAWSCLVLTTIYTLLVFKDVFILMAPPILRSSGPRSYGKCCCSFKIHGFYLLLWGYRQFFMSHKPRG